MAEQELAALHVDGDQVFERQVKIVSLAGKYSLNQLDIGTLNLKRSRERDSFAERDITIVISLRQEHR